MPARVSFHVTILSLFVTLTTLLSATVIYLGYKRNSENTVLAADRLLEQTTSRIVVATDRLIEPLFALTNAAVTLPGVDAAADLPGEHPLAPILFDVLERYPQIAAAYMGNGRGDFYRISSINSMRQGPRAFLRAPAEAVFGVQTIDASNARRFERWRFLDADKRELGSITDPNEEYDPRKRPWYIAALGSKAIIVTDYYVFALPPSIGLTVARDVGDAKGTVFGADLTLTSISRYLAQVRASQLAGTSNANLALFKSDGRLLAHSDNAAYERVLATSGARIPSVTEIPDAGVMAAIADRYIPGAPPNLRIRDGRGIEWLAHVAPLVPAFGAGSYLAVAVPVDDLLGPLAKSARETLVDSLLVVLAFLPVVYFATRAVSGPLVRLTGEVDKMRALDWGPGKTEHSSIAEIQDLAKALVAARSMLAAFAKYVPKNLVRQLVASEDQPKLGGERRPLSVFFSDVKDFTTLSEQLAPERLMEFTSAYLEGLVDIIIARQGTVDKFVGDQIMAYWNAPTANPNHAHDACRAVLACRDWSNAANAEAAKAGEPVLYTRFALHLGDAIVGNVGSSDRMDYTVMGATINLGSRIEGLNKIYGTQVLVTQPVVDAVGDNFVHRPVDRVLPKGAVHPLVVHELLGIHPEAADSPELRVGFDVVARCGAWRAFYEIYTLRDWQGAASALADFRARHGDDSLTAIYDERLRRFQVEAPSADWDGVIRYTQK